tara:strand:- start:1214 stop:1540 length:327 start_codon:yes stop_codon:yes gene_type:complete
MIILVSFLTVLCFLLIYKLYRYSLIILRTEVAIEESLDILNERYESMSKILEKEIFFDSVEIRQVINDVKISHDAIYAVALKMTGENKINDSQIEEKSKSTDSKNKSA